jgi:hypothetical protein
MPPILGRDTARGDQVKEKYSEASGAPGLALQVFTRGTSDVDGLPKISVEVAWAPEGKMGFWNGGPPLVPSNNEGFGVPTVEIRLDGFLQQVAACPSDSTEDDCFF